MSICRKFAVAEPSARLRKLTGGLKDLSLSYRYITQWLLDEASSCQFPQDRTREPFSWACTVRTLPRTATPRYHSSSPIASPVLPWYAPESTRGPGSGCALVVSRALARTSRPFAVLAPAWCGVASATRQLATRVPVGVSARHARTRRYFSNVVTCKGQFVTPPQMPPKDQQPLGTTIVHTSLARSNIAQVNQHLNTLICRVPSVRERMCGCDSYIINSIVGELLCMGHQVIPTCVRAKKITTILQMTNFPFRKR